MKPKKFRFDTGSWNDLNVVELVNESLGIGKRYGFTVKVEPSREDWEEFLGTLKDLRIQEWKKYYDNPDILDGHQWSFEIESEDLEVQTGGTNGYPEKDPTQTVFEYERSLFQELEYAIDKLTGRKLKEVYR